MMKTYRTILPLLFLLCSQQGLANKEGDYTETLEELAGYEVKRPEERRISAGGWSIDINASGLAARTRDPVAQCDNELYLVGYNADTSLSRIVLVQSCESGRGMTFSINRDEEGVYRRPPELGSEGLGEAYDRQGTLGRVYDIAKNIDDLARLSDELALAKDEYDRTLSRTLQGLAVVLILEEKNQRGELY